MNIKNFRTKNVDLTFEKKDKIIVLDSKYMESFFNAIKNIFCLYCEDWLAIITAYDINPDANEELYLECEHENKIYGISIREKPNKGNSINEQNKKEIIFTDMKKRESVNSNQTKKFFFLPEYLFCGCYRMVSCFGGAKNKYYTQEVLDYWMAIGDENTQNIVKHSAIDLPKIIIDNYGVEFVKDPWGDMTFGIYDEDALAPDKEEQFEIIDFLTANQLTDMLMNNFGMAEGPPMFIINQLGNKSEQIIGDMITTMRKTGRQVFIFEDKRISLLSKLCDKEIR